MKLAEKTVFLEVSNTKAGVHGRRLNWLDVYGRRRLGGVGLVVLASMLASGGALAVVNGTAVQQQEQRDKGLITVLQRGAPGVFGEICSGVLLVQDWVLTAGHCAIANRTDRSALRIRHVGQDAAVDAIYLFGGWRDEVGPDRALLHLPSLPAGWPATFRNRVWPFGEWDVLNSTVAFYG